jgi:hypothetical protein
MKAISINKAIAINVTTTNQDNRIILFDNVLPSNIPDVGVVSVNGFLKNLKAFSEINSLASAPIPDITLEDTDQDRLIKIMNIEWGNPRIQLDLEFSSDGINFIKVGAISLINQLGYPYRNYSLLDFYTDGLAAEIGTNGKISCQIKNVSYGKLTVSDKLTIYGSVAQEIIFDENPDNKIAVPSTKSILANENTLLLDSYNRLGATLFNGSNETIFVGYSATVDNTNYSIRLSPGKGYEFPLPMYSGKIYGYSVNVSTVQITEFRSD